MFHLAQYFAVEIDAFSKLTDRLKEIIAVEIGLDQEQTTSKQHRWYAQVASIRKRQSEQFGKAIRRAKWFTAPYPADTIVEVSALALPQLMIEIDVIALVDGEIIG